MAGEPRQESPRGAAIGSVLRRAWRHVARRPLVSGLIVLGLLVALLVLDVLPALLVGPDDKLTTAERLKAENDVRTTLLQALVGGTLLAGLYFTARTFQLNREGQVTERFTRAIQQLGDKSLDVRLGGIYALERIAQSSQREYGPIIEVLTAFVREHAALPADATANDSRAEPEQSDVGIDERAKIGPRLDVQTVLTVLGRSRRDWDHQPLDLQRTDLRGANFERADLQGADLRGANLQFANLSRSQSLSNVNLMEADVGNANFYSARLVGADLNRANLKDVWANGANLDRRTCLPTASRARTSPLQACVRCSSATSRSVKCSYREPTSERRGWALATSTARGSTRTPNFRRSSVRRRQARPSRRAAAEQTGCDRRRRQGTPAEEFLDSFGFAAADFRDVTESFRFADSES